MFLSTPNGYASVSVYSTYAQRHAPPPLTCVHRANVIAHCSDPRLPLPFNTSPAMSANIQDCRSFGRDGPSTLSGTCAADGRPQSRLYNARSRGSSGLSPVCSNSLRPLCRPMKTRIARSNGVFCVRATHVGRRKVRHYPYVSAPASTDLMAQYDVSSVPSRL
jgi:hypothetical protein